MSPKVDELYEAASNLSPAERAALAGLLVDGLEGAIDPEIEDSWRTEIAKRLSELDSGTARTSSWEDVKSKIR